MILNGTIHTDPKPKARPRLTKSGRAYNPESTRIAQQKQALLLRQIALKSEYSFPIPKNVPLEVSVRFFHKGKRPACGKPKITVPDIDNLLKLFLDAVTDARIWKTDAQITKLISEDLWSEKARIEFSIKRHEPEMI